MVLTTLTSLSDRDINSLLYVTAMIPGQRSPYRGTEPSLLTPVMAIVYILFTSPLKEHESVAYPPFPAANTNIEPFPFRPYDQENST